MMKCKLSGLDIINFKGKLYNEDEVRINFQV